MKSLRFSKLSKHIDQQEWMNGYASPPKAIDLLLTNDCNLNCSYCPRVSIQRDSPSSFEAIYMDTRKALALLDEIKEFRPDIRLFGGEPFLHPDWDVIVKYAYDRGMFCASVTNGTLLHRDARRILRSGMTAVGISLDGHELSLSTERGKGIYEKCLAGLNQIRSLKYRYQNEYPNVQIYTTVNEKNFDHLIDFAYFLLGKGISLYRIQQLIWFSSKDLKKSLSILRNHMGDVEFFGPEYGFIRENEPAIDCEKMAKQISTLKKQKFPFSVIFHPDLATEQLRLYHMTGFERDVSEPCRTIDNCSYIDPQGRLYPCMTIEVGNVFETSFKEAWNGLQFRQFRQMIRKTGRLPICTRCVA